MVRKLFSSIGRWLDIIRRVVVNVFFVLVILIFIVSLMTARPKVPDGAALVLNPTGALVEQIEQPSPADLVFGSPTGEQTRMRDLLAAIRHAKEDPRIKLMILDPRELTYAPLSKLQDLRTAIEDFKASGKPVIAVADYYTQSQYYLAATADKIFLHPMGVTIITGFSYYRNYFKDALDQLKVEITLFRVGEYKSFAEPLVRRNMSDQAREANRAWLNVLWQAYRQDIAQMRGIKPQLLQDILNRPSSHLTKHEGSLARLALNAGLVDRLATRDEADAHIKKLLGEQGAGLKYSRIGYKKYLLALGGPRSAPKGDQWVGVIVASGPILDGEQPQGVIGGDSLAKLLRKAFDTKRIKAVVLRVDSPGGSALASEVIRREIERLKKAGKPVVVSMSSVAASGGYWISSPADEIWANPTTLTGSIGVIGFFVGLNKSMEAIGVHTDGVGTTTIAGGMRADRPLHPEMDAVMKMNVRDAYREFMRKVAEGRKLKLAQVEKIAKGRVWSGVDARKLGLVDKLGGLKQAIAAAARLAGISKKKYDAVYVEPELSLRDVLVQQIFGHVRAWFGEHVTAARATLSGSNALRQVGRQIKILQRFNDPRSVYAYCEMPAM